MSYDLHAVKKDIKSIRVGAFSWPIFLQETGAGYVLGYGEGLRPATYVYQSGNNGSPASNDGYKVSASEAKAMAMVMFGFVSVQKFVISEWEKIEPEQQEEMKKFDCYKMPWHIDRLTQLEEIAKFIQESGGFRIT